jgi:hypothetical protein
LSGANLSSENAGCGRVEDTPVKSFSSLPALLSTESEKT